MTLKVKGFGVTKQKEQDLTSEFQKFAKEYPNRTLFKIRAKDDVHIIIKCGGKNFMDVVTGKILRFRHIPFKFFALTAVNDISQYVVVNAFSVQNATIDLEE